MNGKRFVLLLILMAMVAVGCRGRNGGETTEDPPTDEGGRPGGGQTQGENAQVTLLFAVAGWERARYDEIVKQFEEENPAIDIEVITVEEISGSYGLYDENGDPTAGMLKLMQGADVFNYHFDHSTYRPGLFLDMGPLLDSDPTTNRDDFHSGVLDVYSSNGEIWALPMRSGYGLFFYNKDLFDAAGVAYPEPGWTWDDLMAKAQALTQRSGNKTETWGASLTSFSHSLMLASQGVNPTVQNGTILEPNFLDPQIEEAVRTYAAPFLSDRIFAFEYYDPETGQLFIDGEPNEFGIYGLIDQGKVGMWMEYADAWQYRKDNSTFKIGVAPFPVSELNPNSNPLQSFGTVFAISAGTQKRDAAWKFISYMTANIEQMTADYERTSLPARRSASARFWQEADEEFSQALRFASDHAFAYNPYSSTVSFFDTAVQAYINGDKSLEAALEDAQAEAEEMVAEQIKALQDKPAIDDFVVNEPSKGPVGAITVNFVVASGDPMLFRESAKQFNAANQNIVVRVLEPNYFNMQEYDIEQAIGEADCFQWWGGFPAEEANLVLNPQPFFDADPEFGPEMFFPATLTQMSAQGQLLGIPHEVAVNLMNYNKDIYSEAGRPFPQPGWTMDDFLADAVALTSEGSEATKVWGFVANAYEFGDMIMFAERQGADFFDTESNPPKATFDTPEVRESIQWFVDMAAVHQVRPTIKVVDFHSPDYDPENDPWLKRQALILNKRAAIWTGDMFGYVEYSPEGQPLETDLSWIGYIPFPVGPAGGVGFDSVSGFYIKATTQQRQGCWEWIKYAVQDPALIAYGLPAHIPTADSSEMAQRYTKERVEMLKASIANSVRGTDQGLATNNNGWLGMTNGWLERGYNDVLDGEKTVAEAVKGAQKMADDFAACVVAADATDNFQVVDECAREIDPQWGQSLP